MRVRPPPCSLLSDGRTGWAVQMVIDNNNNKVYVYEQLLQSWYFYNYTKESFELLKAAPIVQESFAGIGTRKINQAGIKAIETIL